MIGGWLLTLVALRRLNGMNERRNNEGEKRDEDGHLKKRLLFSVSVLLAGGAQAVDAQFTFNGLDSNADQLVISIAARAVSFPDTTSFSNSASMPVDLEAAPLPGESHNRIPNTSAVNLPSTCGMWQLRSPIPTNTLYGVATTSNGSSAFVAGGYSREFGSDVNQFRRYDSATDTWTTLAPMLDVNFLASAVYSPVNNKVYVFGGDHSSNNTAQSPITVGGVIVGSSNGMATGSLSVSGAANRYHTHRCE